MAVDILMPALSPTMETGTLAKWNVAVGDSVRSGDVIAEIETDKATMEVEAVDEGVLAAILIDAGTEGVAVGTAIARLAEDGENADDVAAAPAPATPAKTPVAVEAPAASAAVVQPSVAAAPPVAVPIPAQPVATAADRIFATPLARRIARDGNLDLSGVSGSGPHGRILRRDVEDALSRPATSTASAQMTMSHAPASPGASTLVPNNPDAQSHCITPSGVQADGTAFLSDRRL